MSHPFPVQPFSTETTPTSRCSPTRSLSLLSISSGTSLGSFYEITKGEPIVSQIPEKHEAWGSFILLRSAKASLREFVSVSPSYYTNQSPQRRRTSSYNIRTPTSSHRKNAPNVPHITRTLPSPVRPPSTTSSSSSMRSSHQSDLHPILAQLETKSKFCTQKVYCSTCKKSGSDFPSCGKCPERWCSRSCRLVGGKRHVCISKNELSSPE